MIVVADTTPIHYLVLLGHADILHTLYERVSIPEAVFRELQASSTPAVVKEWVAKGADWLQVRRASVPQDLAQTTLDPGEREAIALAIALRADALIIDDRAARREAERRGVRAIGTLRVLDDAALAGLVNLSEAVRQLQSAGFYLDPRLAQFLLDRHSKR
jgi:predicted nucleic acid-binding protein